MTVESPERRTTLTVHDECDDAPPKLSLEQAHRLMRRHRHFPGSQCPVRQAALTLLVAAGHYRLAGPPAERIAYRRRRQLADAAAQPGKRTSLLGQITEQLRREIQQGHWPIGGRIPTEAQLTAATGLGRNTIREAVQALVHAGMLERRPGAGTFVVATSAVGAAMARFLCDVPERDVGEVRRLLDTAAAALAACRRDSADIAELIRLAGQRRSAWGRESPRAVEADLALHRAIFRASHNAVYTEFHESLAAARSPISWCRARFPDDPLHAEHDVLVRAVIDGDGDGAASAARLLFDAQPVPPPRPPVGWGPLSPSPNGVRPRG